MVAQVRKTIIQSSCLPLLEQDVYDFVSQWIFSPLADSQVGYNITYRWVYGVSAHIHVQSMPDQGKYCTEHIK